MTIRYRYVAQMNVIRDFMVHLARMILKSIILKFEHMYEFIAMSRRYHPFLVYQSYGDGTGHVASRTRLINPRGCRSPGNNNETPFMHAWIPPLPPPRPLPQPPSSPHLTSSTWASSHSPAAIRRSAALTATLAAPCSPHCPPSTPPPQTNSSFESSYPSSAASDLSSIFPSSSCSSFSSFFSIRILSPFFTEAFFLYLLICFVLFYIFMAFIPPALWFLVLLRLRSCLPGTTACPCSLRIFSKKSSCADLLWGSGRSLLPSVSRCSLRTCDMHIPFSRRDGDQMADLARN